MWQTKYALAIPKILRVGVFFPPCGVKVISYGASIDRGFLCLCSFWLVTRHWLTNQIVKQLHYHGSNISRYTRLKNTCFFEYIDFYPKTNVDPPIWTDTNTQRSTHILDSHPVSRTSKKKSPSLSLSPRLAPGGQKGWTNWHQLLDVSVRSLLWQQPVRGYSVLTCMVA